MNESTQAIKKVSGAVTVWGVLTIILGFFAMGSPLITGLALAMLVGISMIVAGLAQTIYAFQAGSVGQGKGWVIFNGIITLVLGLMIWRGWPVSGAWAIGILVGVRLIFSGMTMLALGSVGRGVADGPSSEQ